MRSPTEAGPGRVSPEAFALALLAASSLQIMENLLPRIPLFPWMRIGFSYAIILPFLLHFGPRAAFALLLGRNCISLLYGGQPMTTFLIGSGSGAIALLGLGYPAAWAYRRGWLGLPGVSILLATGFNIAQLALVNLTLIRHSGFYFQTGPILAWSLLSGAAVALLIRFSGTELESLLAARPAHGGMRPGAPIPGNVRNFLAGSALMLILFPSPAYAIQVPALALLGLAARGRAWPLLQAWPFFLYLAWLHLFHTPGRYLIGEWITLEGVREFGAHALRLANLILLGRWLSGNFPWQWAGNARSHYVQGFLLSLPLLSDMFGSSLESGREMFRRIRAGKREGLLAPAFEAWRSRMEAAARASRAKEEESPDVGSADPNPPRR